MSVVSATSEEVSFVKAGGVGMNTEDSLGCSIIAAPMTEYDVVLEDAVAAVETIASSPATSPIEKTEDRSSIAFSCPTVMAALMSPVAKCLPPPPTSPVIPGTKDSDGFLTPPPASTLLLRRTRTNSTGSSTYVIASSSLSPGPSTSKPAVVGVSGNGNVTALSHDVYAQSRKSFMKRSSRERDGNFVPGGRSNKKPKMDGKLSNILSAPSTHHHNSQSRNSSSGHSTVFAQPHHPHFRPSIISPLALNPPQSLCVTITSQRSVSTFSPTPRATSPSSSSSSFGFPVPEPGVPRKPVSRGKPAYITEIHSDPCGKGSKGRSERVSDGKEIKRKVSRRKRLGWDKKGSRYRKRYYSESLNVYSPEHMGDWRPTDDLRLIVNILQTNSLKLVHRGVRFSCIYAIYNLRARWYALLYDKPTGKVSQAAIHKLHPKVVQDVYKKALFSKKEHALLKSIKSTHDLKCLLPKMEKLLHDNPLTFLKWRTPKVMAEEWLLLKDCQLLCDQDVRKYFEHESFNQFEASVRRRRGRRLPRRLLKRKRKRDGGLRRELKLETRFARGRIRVLEEEVAHWQLIADMVTELDPNPFEEGSYAMLRGKQVRYLMRSREITLGRRSEFKTVPIDADLSLEGSTYKISRRQATIQLRTLGDFCIMNHGKHSFFVDGRMVEPGKMDRLFDQSVIEISRLRFIFIVNTKVLNDYISKQIRIEVKREMCDLQKLARAIKAASAASSAGGTSPTSAAAAHLYALTAQSGVVDAVLAASGYPSPKYEDGTTPAISPSSSLNSVPNSLALALSSMISLSSGTNYKPQANSRPVSPATSSLTSYSNSIAAAAAALSRCPTPSAGSSFTPYSNSIAAAAAAVSRSPTLSAGSSFAPYSTSIAAATAALSRSTPPACSSFTPTPYSSSLAAAAAALSRSPTPSAGSSSRSASPALSSSTSTGSRSNSPAFPAGRPLDSSNSGSPTFFGPSTQPGISSQRPSGLQFGTPPTTSNSTHVAPVTSGYDSTLAVIDAVASGLSPLPPVPSPLTLALARPPTQSPIVRPYIQPPPPPYAGAGPSNQRIPITIYRNSSPPPPTNLSQPQQHPMQITTFPPSSMEPPISSPVQFGDLTIRPGLPPPPQPQTQQEPAVALK